PQFMECAGFLARQRFLTVRDALAQTADTRRQFVFGDNAFGLAVDEARPPLAPLAPLAPLGAIGAGGRDWRRWARLAEVAPGGVVPATAAQRRGSCSSMRWGSWRSRQTSAHTAAATAASGEAGQSRTPPTRWASLPRRRE